MFLDWGISLGTTNAKRITFVNNLRKMEYLKMKHFLEGLQKKFDAQLLQFSKQRDLIVYHENL
jgi:hypothetical protein